MGFDTYHDSVNKGTSVGALVSSTNNTFTKYSSSCLFHKNKEEITMGMKALVMTVSIGLKSMSPYFNDSKY